MPSHGFRRAAVVGAGLMGSRIAAVLAAGGLRVTLHDSDLAGAVRDADLVIEAVTEDLAVKQDLRSEGRATREGDVTWRPGGERQAEWNPPDLIPVVEVVPGRDTSAIHAERTVALLQDLGKTPVLVRKDIPGFVGNRLPHALWREAIALVAGGICDAETVDLVARNTIGLRLARMGPIENADYVGLDLTLAIHQAVFPALCADQGPAEVLRQLVMRKELGAKTGRGFFDWPPGAREKAARDLAAHVKAQLSGGRR